MEGKHMGSSSLPHGFFCLTWNAMARYQLPTTSPTTWHIRVCLKGTPRRPGRTSCQKKKKALPAQKYACVETIVSYHQVSQFISSHQVTSRRNNEFISKVFHEITTSLSQIIKLPHEKTISLAPFRKNLRE